MPVIPDPAAAALPRYAAPADGRLADAMLADNWLQRGPGLPLRGFAP